MKIDKQVFVSSGSKGGAARGPTKNRGTPEYYRGLAVKSAAARKAKRERIAADPPPPRPTTKPEKP